MNTIGEIISLFLASIVFALPGVLAVAALVPGLTVGERWSIGTTTGFAAAALVAVVVSHASLRFFLPVWGLLSAVAAILWLRGRQVRLYAMPDGIDAWLVLLLLLVAGTRFGIASRHIIPPGFDPAFHLLLARKIALTQHMIFDWSPFEAIALNYPVGSHFLVVILSSLARLELHDTFRLLCPLLGLLETALVFHFSTRVSGNRELGLYAALTFGLWADYGSIGYYGWGGLPNELGICFLIALLALLVEERPGSGTRAVMAILLAAIFVSHHHVMIVSCVLVGVLIVFFSLRSAGETRHRALLQVVATAVLLASIYLLPYVGKSVTLGATYVLRFDEVFFDPITILSSMGWAFALSVLAGLVLALADRRISFQPILPCAVLVTLGLFVVFEYLYRWLARALFGHDYVAFTPSRFLTDLTCFLAVYAGLALLRLRELLARRRAVIVVGAIFVSLTLLPRWRELEKPTVPEGFREAGEWIRMNTSPDTIVMNSEAWASYLTWRRTMVTPLPISEPLDHVVPRELAVRELMSGTRAAPSPEMKIVGIAYPGKWDPSTRILWHHSSGFSVVEIWPVAPRPD